MHEDKHKRAVRGFEDLAVYRKAYALSLEVHRFSLTMPRIEQYALADQVRRASKSICANIAEGFGKQRMSSAKFRRFLSMAIGSADEMKVWLSFCRDLEHLDADICMQWQEQYSAIARMLNGLHGKWK